MIHFHPVPKLCCFILCKRCSKYTFLQSQILPLSGVQLVLLQAMQSTLFFIDKTLYFLFISWSHEFASLIVSSFSLEKLDIKFVKCVYITAVMIVNCKKFQSWLAVLLKTHEQVLGWRYKWCLLYTNRNLRVNDPLSYCILRVHFIDRGALREVANNVFVM